MKLLAVLMICWVSQAYAAQGDIITIIGTTQTSTGQSMLANDTQIGSPEGVTIDSTGNIYFADASNHQILKMDRATGLLTVIAGTGMAGYTGDGGQATLATLNHPVSLAFSPAGELYFSDSNNSVIRKINLSTGIISTVVGSGVRGFSGDGGAATLAQLNYPSGIAFDNAGNLFIADTSNHRVRKVDVTGVINTVAGTTLGYSGDGGAATLARLYNPSGIAIDQNNNVYIADTLNHRIRKIDTAGIITTVAGTGLAGYSGDGGQGSFAQLSQPYDIHFDATGNLMIADTANHRIRKLNLSTGVISTVVGSGSAGFAGDGGAALQASLYYPYRFTVDTYSNFYIADFTYKVVRMAGNVIDIPASVSFPVVDTYGAQQYFQSLSLSNNSGGAAQNIHYQLPSAIATGSFAIDVKNSYVNQVLYNVPVFVSDYATGGLGAMSVEVTYNGVRLHALNIIASPPDRVDILLRAVESNTTNDKPVTIMTQQDFMVEEDGLPLSVESKVLIKKVTELKHVVQTVLMFDVSSSISVANLQLMKQSVKNALIDPNTGLLRTKDQQVAIYTFDDTVRLVQDFTFNSTTVAAAIDGIASQGVTSTNLYGAIIQGMAKPVTQASLTNLSEGHVVVITDGRDTSGYHTLYQATSAINASENTLHLIGVQSPDLQPATMQLLSKHYTEVGNFTAVEQAMNDIAAYTDALAYSFYQVYYNSPARAGTLRSQCMRNIAIIMRIKLQVHLTLLILRSLLL